MAVQRDPIREWRERWGRQVFNLDFEPVSDAPFHGSFKSIFDGRRVIRAEFSPGLAVRRRVTDIALQVGFSDAWHFNRLFRSRFGDTPKGVRADARKGSTYAGPIKEP